MKTNKYIAAFLAAMMSVCVLVGCGGKTAANTAEIAPDQTEMVATAESSAGTEALAEETSAPEETAPGFTPEAGSVFIGLPAYEDGAFVGWRDQGNASELTAYQAQDSNGYEDYVDKLVGEGFSICAENEIHGNLFSTYSNGETDVTLMYVPAIGQSLIAAEPAGALPSAEEDNIYEKVCEPLVCMVGVDYDGERSNGMCYLYRLSDGSFIVVDGGFNAQECADTLFSVMQELSPDPDNIVIAAWFITHAHMDHMGCFCMFSETHASDVILERLIANFPSEKAFEASETSMNKLVKFENAGEAFPGVQIIKTHPGQVFYLRDAVIEMLYTWDLYPMNRAFTFFNNSSLVFTVELGGQKLMQMGDCGPVASPIIAQMYGEDLDSDIIQVAHHGLIGSTEELNELINPEVVLWPATQRKYKELRSNKNNEPFENIEDIYVADHQAWVLHLPYSADTVESWDVYEIE